MATHGAVRLRGLRSYKRPPASWSASIPIDLPPTRSCDRGRYYSTLPLLPRGPRGAGPGTRCTLHWWDHRRPGPRHCPPRPRLLPRRSARREWGSDLHSAWTRTRGTQAWFIATHTLIACATSLVHRPHSSRHVPSATHHGPQSACPRCQARQCCPLLDDCWRCQRMPCPGHAPASDSPQLQNNGCVQVRSRKADRHPPPPSSTHSPKSSNQ
jgi:hypothetical protein